MIARRFIHICCWNLLFVPMLAFCQQSIVLQDIRIIGNQKTRPWIIERECLFQKGDTIPTADVPRLTKQTQQNLYNLGLFNSVIVSTGYVPGGLQIIIQLKERWYIFGYPIVQLEERNSYDLINALRAGDFHRISLGGQIKWRNLTGRNETLSVGLQWGFSKRFQVEFLRPALFRAANLDFKASFQFTSEPEIIIGTENGVIQWRRLATQALRRQLAGHLAMSKRISPTEWLSASAGYREVRVADSLFSFLLDGEKTKYTSTGQTTEAYPLFVLDWVRDLRDVRAYPLKGHKLHLYGKYAGWGGGFSSHFAKLGATWVQHIPLSPRWNVTYGLQEILTLGKAIPFYEKSYLGLTHQDFLQINYQLRGYEPFALGATWQNLLKSELKFAIVPYQTVRFPFIPWKSFQTMPLGIYITTFAEGAYLRDQSHTRQDDTFLDQPLIGYGFGLNLCGFYDMLGRLEYSWNHLGQGGLYLHAILPIK